MYHLGAGVLVLVFAGEAIERASRARGGRAGILAGYFILRLEPMLPSTHSMVAPSSQVARWVTRL